MYRFLVPLAAAVLLAACSSPDAPPTAPATGASTSRAGVAPDTRAKVRSLVERFGERMQEVSTLAPPGPMHRQLQAVCGELLSPRLLETWQAHPARVVGREVSSPWPQRIEIDRVDCAEADACRVTGEVDYVTSSELADGGVYSRRGIVLEVGHVEAGWRITQVHLASTQRARGGTDRGARKAEGPHEAGLL